MLTASERAEVDRQTKYFTRPLHEPQITNRIKRLEIVVHSGWSRHSLQDCIQRRVERIQKMDQKTIDETFFISLLGGLLPEERRSEIHKLWGAYMANELEHYPMTEAEREALQIRAPQCFRELLGEFWFSGFNFTYADVQAPASEILLSKVISKRTRQFMELPAMFDGQEVTSTGLKMDPEIPKRWEMGQQVGKIFNFLIENRAYISSHLETVFYGEHEEECVAGVKWGFDRIFREQFPSMNIDSKILPELCIRYADVRKKRVREIE